MDMAWFRDLSITVLGFLTSVVLIFAAILFCSLYRKITATLALVQTLIKSINITVNTLEGVIKTTSQSINDTVSEVKGSIKEVKNRIDLLSKGISDSISQVQEGIKPMLSVFSIICGIQNGFKFIKKLFKKEYNEKGDENGQGSDN
jgi:methyl-accepting chemotaxis protein